MQMYQGELPLLTKGPFSIFYGGEEIIPHLSKISAGRGFIVLIMCSSIFQISVLIQSKSRKLQGYPQVLTKTMVENVLNMYGIMGMIVISIICVTWGILHQWSIQMYKRSESPVSLVPKEILVLFLGIFLTSAVPFMKSYALR